MYMCFNSDNSDLCHYVHIGVGVQQLHHPLTNPAVGFVVLKNRLHIGMMFTLLYPTSPPHKCTPQNFKISKRARRPEWAKCKRRRRSGGRAPCSVRSSRSGPMPDSMRPAMAVAPQLPHAAAAAGHDAAPRLTPRGASTASFQHFKAISRSDRCACARPGQFVHPNQPLRGVSRNISLAFSQNVQCNHFATGPVSKPRSKIPRVVRTERPALTHTC